MPDRLPVIRAEDVPAGLQFTAESGPLELTAAEGGDGRKRFSILGYTGGLLRVAGWFSIRTVKLPLSTDPAP